MAIGLTAGVCLGISLFAIQTKVTHDGLSGLNESALVNELININEDERLEP